ncbi:hypothetical protein L1987_04930 [Smallanthus sonchifolius]|uniref:Uncharacterized protein n=1 Tax=Smallanthus sonchifolius TaxID=185202 RepID=A0ACB9JU06_9ASTR|nr:hypothetical protein L1987_04930 [Smallanthus sonchifolius]
MSTASRHWNLPYLWCRINICNMPKSSADEIILSYNDAVLRQSDLGILNGPYYLNDRIIEFYFSYLSSSHPSEHILLVPPSIAFWIMNCPDTSSLKDFLQPLNLPSKKLIIFPVNNNDDVTAAAVTGAYLHLRKPLMHLCIMTVMVV